MPPKKAAAAEAVKEPAVEEEAPVKTVESEEKAEETVTDEVQKVEEEKEKTVEKKKNVRKLTEAGRLRWEAKQKKLEELLVGKERVTPEADQYRLLVPTSLAEKLSETDKLQTIIDQIKEEDLESDIILQLSEESKVETSWVVIEGDKESTEETKSEEDESSTQKAADSILIIQATREGLEKALSLLAPELHLADSDPPRKGYELRLMVPNHCLSVILGEGGKTVLGLREQTTSFIQAFTDPLPVSQENTVRIQHKQYEGLVNAVVKIYDLISDVKSSVGIVQYKPFWFKQCAHDNTGSYTDTFYYEKTLPANNRNTPFYDNSKAIEKRKRKLEATKKIQENTKKKAALTRGGSAGKRGRGAPGPWMRGAPHPGMGMRGRGRGGPGMGMYPGFRPPRAGRMRGFGAQRFPSSPALRGRGGPPPSMHYAASYDDGSYNDYGYFNDSYMDSAYMGDSYMNESYYGESYTDEDSFAAGMAEGLAAGMAMAARKASAIGTSGRARRPRGRGLAARGAMSTRGARGATMGRNMGAAMRGMGYGGGYW